MGYGGRWEVVQHPPYLRQRTAFQRIGQRQQAGLGVFAVVGEGELAHVDRDRLFTGYSSPKRWASSD